MATAYDQLSGEARQEDAVPNIKALIAQEEAIGRLRMLREESSFEKDALSLDKVIEDVSACQRAMHDRPALQAQLELLSKLEDSLGKTQSKIPHLVLGALSKEADKAFSPCPTAGMLKQYAEQLCKVMEGVRAGAKQIPVTAHADFQFYPAINETTKAGNTIYYREDCAGDDAAVIEASLKAIGEMRHVMGHEYSQSGPIYAWWQWGLCKALTRGRYAWMRDPDFLRRMITDDVERKSNAMLSAPWSSSCGMPWSALGWLAGVLCREGSVSEVDFIPSINDSYLHGGTPDGKMYVLCKFEDLLGAEVLPKLSYDLQEWKAVKLAKLNEAQMVRAKLYALGFAVLVSSGQLAAQYAKDWLKDNGWWLDVTD